ncbi:hypothetical protein UFOVP276_56 [uncultured Caudovirales phage]|uniref:Uncharacterized protein n=1 Tax=uncultured Caudovirales phage TaxID=2100421 RepID=A0A6J5LKM4_9CAUD|nr:hypothetical protein UFOVP127_193 [uncultured Caudovirales phage]CAB4135054.1 hypothetical protein UFOVP276_56 [uncultured Caudovirales phage]
MESKTKISAAQAAQVYAEVPTVLRKLASERDQLQRELDGYRLGSRIVKIAQLMEDKKINLGLSREEKVSQIKEAHANGRSLEAIEEAIEMTSPNGEIAKMASDDTGNGTNSLESYLLGDLA